MFNIRLAGLIVTVNNTYPQLERFCRDYICTDGTPDFSVSATPEELAAERQASEIILGKPAAPAYAESICVYRHICRRLPEYDAFLFHASVVECDGNAYAFAAKSGTGKSTHTALWLKHFGSRARIINGDKPIFRLVDGAFRAYGTPWCGKEGYNVNSDSPLTALCFLERGENNEIRKIDSDDAVLRIFPQILMPDDEKTADLLFPLLDRALASLPCFVLKCTISDDAVTVAYNAMLKGNKQQ